MIIERIPELELMEDEEQCRVYDKYASNPDALNDYVNLYEKFIGISKGIVVDLGCGSCNFIIALAKNYPNLNFICYENSSAMIKIALENITKNDLSSRIKIIRDDFLNAIGNFDVVLANRVLHHTSDTVSFWKVVNKLSRCILVVDINRPSQDIIDKIDCDDPIYKKDLVNSLKAAYVLEEIRLQIKNYSYNLISDNKNKIIVYQTR
jgi:2-polyprenyl-3-methyl-5-hydroxy-6-metoxy-1,4-benzoquinol methylase